MIRLFNFRTGERKTVQGTLTAEFVKKLLPNATRSLLLLNSQKIELPYTPKAETEPYIHLFDLDHLPELNLSLKESDISRSSRPANFFTIQKPATGTLDDALCRQLESSRQTTLNYTTTQTSLQKLMVALINEFRLGFQQLIQYIETEYRKHERDITSLRNSLETYENQHREIEYQVRILKQVEVHPSLAQSNGVKLLSYLSRKFDPEKELEEAQELISKVKEGLRPIAELDTKIAFLKFGLYNFSDLQSLSLKGEFDEFKDRIADRHAPPSIDEIFDQMIPRLEKIAQEYEKSTLATSEKLKQLVESLQQQLANVSKVENLILRLPETTDAISQDVLRLRSIHARLSDGRPLLQKYGFALVEMVFQKIYFEILDDVFQAGTDEIQRFVENEDKRRTNFAIIYDIFPGLPSRKSAALQLELTGREQYLQNSVNDGDVQDFLNSLEAKEIKDVTKLVESIQNFQKMYQNKLTIAKAFLTSPAVKDEIARLKEEIGKERPGKQIPRSTIEGYLQRIAELENKNKDLTVQVASLKQNLKSASPGEEEYAKLSSRYETLELKYQSLKESSAKKNQELQAFNELAKQKELVERQLREAEQMIQVLKQDHAQEITDLTSSLSFSSTMESFQMTSQVLAKKEEHVEEEKKKLKEKEDFVEVRGLELAQRESAVEEKQRSLEAKEKELEERLKKELEERLQRELEERLKRELEERLKKELEERLQKELEEKLKREQQLAERERRLAENETQLREKLKQADFHLVKVREEESRLQEIERRAVAAAALERANKEVEEEVHKKLLSIEERENRAKEKELELEEAKKAHSRDLDSHTEQARKQANFFQEIIGGLEGELAQKNNDLLETRRQLEEATATSDAHDVANTRLRQRVASLEATIRGLESQTSEQSVVIQNFDIKLTETDRQLSQSLKILKENFDFTLRVGAGIRDVPIQLNRRKPGILNRDNHLQMERMESSEADVFVGFYQDEMVEVREYVLSSLPSIHSALEKGLNKFTVSRFEPGDWVAFLLVGNNWEALSTESNGPRYFLSEESLHALDQNSPGLPRPKFIYGQAVTIDARDETITSFDITISPNAIF